MIEPPAEKLMLSDSNRRISLSHLWISFMARYEIAHFPWIAKSKVRLQKDNCNRLLKTQYS